MNILRQYVSQLLKEIRGIHVPLRELPPAMIQALASVGYRRPDIEVMPGTSYSPKEGGGASDGSKGFVIVLDMATGQYKTHMGSWGGANAFEKKQVEYDETEYPIPMNGAVIIGSSGNGSFAKIRVRPENMDKMLPSSEGEVSPEEVQVLAIIGGIKGGYRARYFEDQELGPYNASNPLIQSLVSKGLLKTNKRGAVAITAAGKNARGNANPDWTAKQQAQMMASRENG